MSISVVPIDSINYTVLKDSGRPPRTLIGSNKKHIFGDHMKPIFKKSYEELKNYLSEIDGVWDESQHNKKVLRFNRGVMNWYESTGTIQFQGSEEGKKYLENRVKSILYPDKFPIVK